MMDGEFVPNGRRYLEPAGFYLLGVVVGSEVLLGVFTEVTVRILPKPEGARALLIGFPSVESAGQCVADVIAGGIIPAGMEMMDRLAIEAAERSEEHTSELQSLMRISYAVFCLEKKKHEYIQFVTHEVVD